MTMIEKIVSGMLVIVGLSIVFVKSNQTSSIINAFGQSVSTVVSSLQGNSY